MAAREWGWGSLWCVLKPHMSVKATYSCRDTQLCIITNTSTTVPITPGFTHTYTHTSTCSTHSPAARRLQRQRRAQRRSPSPPFSLSPTAALTHYQRDGPVVPVDLQATGHQLLPMAPAAGLRRRRRRWRLGLVVLPQVIKRPQDPRNGQNRDGVGPYPAHGEPIRRAPEASPAGSGPSSAEGAASPPVMGWVAAQTDSLYLSSNRLFCRSAAALLGFAHWQSHGPSAESYRPSTHKHTHTCTHSHTIHPLAPVRRGCPICIQQLRSWFQPHMGADQRGDSLRGGGDGRFISPLVVILTSDARYLFVLTPSAWDWRLWSVSVTGTSPLSL